MEIVIKFAKILFDLLKSTVQEWTRDKASRWAAGIAYYTVFSVSPLLVLIISLAGFVIGEGEVRQEVISETERVMGAEGADFVESLIENINQPGAGIAATAISVFLLLFGAATVFTAVHDALNHVWEVQTKPGFSIWQTVRKRLISFGMVLLFGMLLLASLIADAVIATINAQTSDIISSEAGEILTRGVNLLLFFVLATLLFGTIYKVLPDVKVAWQDVLLGAMVTSALFMLGNYVISFYISRTATTSVYGVAGSLVAILLWVYYSAQIFLFGAEFTQVYANKYGREVRPDDNAVRVQRPGGDPQAQPAPRQAEG